MKRHGGWSLIVAVVLTASAPLPPRGMVHIPAARHSISLGNGARQQVRLKGFWLDSHLVTVQQFAAFVKATAYKTEAEKAGSGAVFDIKKKDWLLQPGASWHHPLGLHQAAAQTNHPVTQVSQADAAAYCQWRKMRLPTAGEWEAAARWRNPHRYAWGPLYAGRANVWTGHFPDANTVEDGYLYTSPIKAFGTNATGFSDLGGNVWQWTNTLAEPGAPATPAAERVLKGGSFLCDSTVCHGYLLESQSTAAGNSSSFHIGFRCACDE